MIVLQALKMGVSQCVNRIRTGEKIVPNDSDFLFEHKEQLLLPATLALPQGASVQWKDYCPFVFRWVHVTPRTLRRRCWLNSTTLALQAPETGTGCGLRPISEQHMQRQHERQLDGWQERRRVHGARWREILAEDSDQV